MQSLRNGVFRNEFVSQFNGDESGDLRPRQTPGVLYSKAAPTPVKKVKLLAWSEELAKEIGVEKPVDQDEIDVLGGNNILPGMYPYAACYAGHQFGHWAGQLGDGRAITLGEWVAQDDRVWELQLKGAGPTPYSRRADGRAVLRSSLREYLMSEAMFHLGVPTTRALSLVTTGEFVMRDMFYDGNPENEPGAIVMRVAPTFLRFGNFEILGARKELENLRKLVDWTIDRYYPHITGEDRVLRWFIEIVDRTAKMISEWMRVGFVHGVMNTDNMSILGLTIDYGPYSFVDDFDYNFTPNTTDLPGRRYAFGKQPSIGKWNLACLAGAIAPLFNDTKALVDALETYDGAYWSYYYQMMSNKLGFDEVKESDIKLIDGLEKTLNAVKPDMTMFFQFLMDLEIKEQDQQHILDHFKEAFYKELSDSDKDKFYNTIKTYINRIEANTITGEERLQKMQAANPRFILRNYLLHNAIEELEKGDESLFVKLQAAMKDPYNRNNSEFFAKRPDWASSKAGCSMLSCSS